MMARWMRTLTGPARRLMRGGGFFEPSDVVGIRSTAVAIRSACPRTRSLPRPFARSWRLRAAAADLRVRAVSESARRSDYAPHLPSGLKSSQAERATGTSTTAATIPRPSLEANLSGRGHALHMTAASFPTRLTKIINIPNVKDHGATGVTGCLKNIAYELPTVARTHSAASPTPIPCRHPREHRNRVFPGRCCRSWTASVGSGMAAPSPEHGGTVFHPRQIMFGTTRSDIGCCSTSSKRSAAPKGRAPSGIDARVPEKRHARTGRGSNVNIIIREPGHVEFASTLARRARPARSKWRT